MSDAIITIEDTVIVEVNLGIPGADSTIPGPPGLSAYQVAVAEGFIGTEAEWLLSLVGTPGADSTIPGPPGADSTVPGPVGPKGDDGAIEYTYTTPNTIKVNVGTLRRYILEAKTITQVFAAVSIAPTGADIIFDIKKNDVSIFAAPQHINAGANTLSIVDFVSTDLAVNDYLTVDIIQVGSTVAGSDLVITIRC